MTEHILMKTARSFLGLQEITGKKHEAKIIAMADDVGVGWINDDETPWCAIFANYVLHVNGFVGTKSAAAKSFLKLKGSLLIDLDQAKQGDIVVFHRPPNPDSGHVFFFLYYDGDDVVGIGGNQSKAGTNGAVTIGRYPKSRIAGIRRPTLMKDGSHGNTPVVEPKPSPTVPASPINETRPPAKSQGFWGWLKSLFNL